MQNTQDMQNTQLNEIPFDAVSPCEYADALPRTQFMNYVIKPLWQGIKRIAGPAFTVKCEAGDHLMLHAAIYRACPGDIIVVEADEVDDEIEELSETAILRIGTQVGIGVIHDNDAVADDLIEQKQPNAISIGTNTVQEGDSRNLRFTIILNDEVQKGNELLLPYYISEDIDSDNVEIDDIILEKLQAGWRQV